MKLETVKKRVIENFVQGHSMAVEKASEIVERHFGIALKCGRNTPKTIFEFIQFCWVDES